jgi:Mg/Co/Ni transporter MgtE
MSPRFLAVRPERKAAELRAFVSRGETGDVFVVAGEDRRLLGRLPLAILVAAGDAQTAADLCEPVSHFLNASDDLWTGLLGIEDFVGYSVPVVADAVSMRLVGVVTESDFITAYRKSVQEIREERGSR